MRLLRSSAALVSAVALLALPPWATPARAGPVPGIEFTSVASTGTAEPNAFVAGWAFTINEAITVTDLGAPFDFEARVGHLPAAVTVGLFDDSGVLLAITQVSNMDALDGHFRYAPVAPLTLTPGQTYTVAALYQANETFIADVMGQATAPQINYVQARFLINPVLAWPTTTDPFLGSTRGEFGGTFRFAPAAVPEPSTLAGCGLIAVALAGYRFRRRKAA